MNPDPTVRRSQRAVWLTAATWPELHEARVQLRIPEAEHGTANELAAVTSFLHPGEFRQESLRKVVWGGPCTRTGLRRACGVTGRRAQTWAARLAWKKWVNYNSQNQSQAGRG